MSGARVLINAPATAVAGEVIEVRTLIAHVMETGHRMGTQGDVIPRNIINRFVCRYDGAEVFTAELFPAIAANPFIAFTVVATRSDTLSFEWTDDQGTIETATRSLIVA